MPCTPIYTVGTSSALTCAYTIVSCETTCGCQTELSLVRGCQSAAVICNTQSTAASNCSFADNILLPQLLLELRRLEGNARVALLLDFYEACDTLDRASLLACLACLAWRSGSHLLQHSTPMTAKDSVPVWGSTGDVRRLLVAVDLFCSASGQRLNHKHGLGLLLLGTAAARRDAPRRSSPIGVGAGGGAGSAEPSPGGDGAGSAEPSPGGDGAGAAVRTAGHSGNGSGANSSGGDRSGGSGGGASCSGSGSGSPTMAGICLDETARRTGSNGHMHTDRVQSKQPLGPVVVASWAGWLNGPLIR